MNKQKFQKGDLVHIAADLGASMSHFTADVDAIVIGSYADQYGGNNTKDYTLHLKSKGQVSWYYETQLTLLERNRLDLLHEWEFERQAEISTKSDLDWIFEHGKEVLKSPIGASVQALADALQLGSLWGERGEGVTYYTRSLQVLALAEPYLHNNDKAGFLALRDSR